MWSCGAYSMDVVDPSGSGDAFTSGVIRSLLQGWDLPQTLRYASASASALRPREPRAPPIPCSPPPKPKQFMIDHPLTVTEGR